MFGRSSDGARAEIAAILSSVRRKVGAYPVELRRWAMYRYLRVKEAVVYEDDIPNACGLSLKRDEPSMRIFPGSNIMNTISVSARCLTHYKNDCSELNVTPALGRLWGKPLYAS